MSPERETPHPPWKTVPVLCHPQWKEISPCVEWKNFSFSLWPYKCTDLFSNILLADPVPLGKVLMGFSGEMAGVSTSGAQRMGFTLENPPSMTVTSSLPGKEKAPRLEKPLDSWLCCSSNVHICF